MQIDREDEDDDAYLALVCLAQALDCVKSAPDMQQCLNACRCFGECELVDVLIQKIGHASDRPHAAYYSVKTLGVISRLAPELVPSQARAVVEEAQRVGVSTHAALENITGNLLSSMHV